MGYLSCRAQSSISTCRSISSIAPSQTPKRRSPSSSSKYQDSNEQQQQQQQDDEDEDDDNDDKNGHHRQRQQQRQIKHFTYAELEAATANFSDSSLLGRGSHGSVFKAVLLHPHHAVAVKRPSVSCPRSEVENEIEILSNIHSSRFVNLIGFAPSSSSFSRRVLVIEFMPNGTLYDLLHTNPHPPNWPRRLRLALQTAKALLALHSSSPPIIHRDVKSANILIDRNFNARLGDFGLAIRLGDANAAAASATPPAGTLGYLDPSYVTPDNLSTKTDVFSFGILLLEIMSGRKAIDVAHSPPSVVEWAVPLLRKGKVGAVFDPRIAPPKNSRIRRQLALLAASCVRYGDEKRPGIEVAAAQLTAMNKGLNTSRRSWNGPCSMVATEGTLTKVKLVEEIPDSIKTPPLPVKKKVLLDADAKTRGARNLMELLARPDGEIVEFCGGRGSVVRRARSMRVTSGHSDRGGTMRSQRNQSVRGDRFEPSVILDDKLHI